MGDRYGARRACRVAATLALSSFIAACALGPAPGPAPVFFKGGEADTLSAPIGGAAVPRLSPFAGVPSEGRHIVVHPGQSIGRLAEEYHVPPRAIIAANHLAPPYKIETGQHLVIPGTGGPVSPGEASAAPLPPLAAAPPAEGARSSPDIIPLDGPPPPKAAAPPQAAHNAAAVEPQVAPPIGPSAAEEARADSAEHAPVLPHGGRLPWPVQGRVLTGYGAASGGGHNVGINIAAPRGAPVRAVDGGVVAYAGNELRGYGNLVLIKHPDGFITAYAHCEELLVHRGDKVTRGEVIAKVGTTGGVSEPQLHFELRRGEHAVDPREFLSPAPTAASQQDTRG